MAIFAGVSAAGKSCDGEGSRGTGESSGIAIAKRTYKLTAIARFTSLLLASADHGALSDVLPLDDGDAEEAIAAFATAEFDDNKLTADLQRKGAESFVASW